MVETLVYYPNSDPTGSGSLRKKAVLEITHTPVHSEVIESKFNNLGPIVNDCSKVAGETKTDVSAINAVINRVAQKQIKPTLDYDYATIIPTQIEKVYTPEMVVEEYEEKGNRKNVKRYAPILLTYSQPSINEKIQKGEDKKRDVFIKVELLPKNIKGLHEPFSSRIISAPHRANYDIALFQQSFFKSI